MVELGNRVTVITSAAHYLTGRIDRPVRGLWSTETESDFTLIRTWAPHDYRRSLLRRLVYYLAYSLIAPVAAATVRRPDVVFSSTDPPFMTPGAYLTARIHRARLVLDERDIYPETLSWLGFRMPQWLRSLLYTWSCWIDLRASAVVTVSPGFVDLLEQRGVRKDRIFLIHNFFPERADRSTGAHQREPKPKGSNGKVKTRAAKDSATRVIYAGGLGQANEVAWILQAASSLDHDDHQKFSFAILGDGERREEYEEYCRSHGLANVVFHGARARDEMEGAYLEADIAVHVLGPQWQNSLSSKVFEYMANALPVVFAGRGDIAKVVTDSGAGIVVPPGDPAALAQALKSLRADTAKRTQMADNARTYISRHFNRGRIRTRLAEALSSR